jgi:hypothetical protein
MTLIQQVSATIASCLAMRAAEQAVTDSDEFKDTTIFVSTSQYVVDNQTSYDKSYHYYGRTNTYCHMGKAFDRTMLDLIHQDSIKSDHDWDGDGERKYCMRDPRSTLFEHLGQACPPLQNKTTNFQLVWHLVTKGIVVTRGPPMRLPIFVSLRFCATPPIFHLRWKSKSMDPRVSLSVGEFLIPSTNARRKVRRQATQ